MNTTVTLDPGAVPTMAFFVASLLASIGCVRFLYKRAFRESLYLSTESSMRYMSIRCRILLLACTLQIVDCCNNLWYWAIHLTRWPTDREFLYFRITWVLTFLMVGDLITVANAMRCSVIVLRDPVSRRRFLGLVVGTCVVVRVASNVDTVMVAMTQVAMDPTERDSVQYLSTYAGFADGIYPLSIIVSSCWSLWMSRREQPRADDRLPSRDQPLQQQPRGSLGFAPQTTTLKVLHTHSAMTRRQSFTSLLGLTPTPSSSSSHGTGSKMSGTFIFLTIALVTLWVTVIFISLAPNPTPVHILSPSSLIASMAIALEASFERLVKLERSSRRRGGETDIDRFTETAVAIAGDMHFGAAGAGGSGRKAPIPIVVTVSVTMEMTDEEQEVT
ncbi:hypothetical protein BC828DRAFT_404747 [Blastocladiella britannica]|nr:hypothetical protein BC828DRAFT_404747 [Blastocladiella britannica]